MKKQPQRFDMNRKPIKPKWYLKIVEYVAAPFFLITNKAKVKIEPEVKKIKGPFLLLSTHQSFMDFPQIIKGIRPHNTTWVISVEEFRGREWLMRGIGGFPKRKFTHDIITAKHMLHSLKKLNYPVTIYHEARFELAGINERLDGAIGKFCKLAKVPVLMCMTNGNFINSPQWSKHPYRKIRQEAHIYQLFTPQQLEEMSVEEIQTKIEQAFVKDEYKWQVENDLHIKCKQRADGLYKILYKCPVCNKEHMNSGGIHLWCEECGAKWEMDTLSRLNGVNTDKGFSHIPDWYRWEREEVKKEVESGEYRFEDEVRVEDFYSAKVGFVDMGTVKMVHDKEGFTFTGEVDGKPFYINKPVSSMYSVHIEYDFLKRGDAIDIAVDHTSYFMFLKKARNALTKLHFAVEELYDYYVRNAKPLTE